MGDASDTADPILPSRPGHAHPHPPDATQWPTFLLIGAQRSGTTSLCDYLGQHPDVFISPEKEPHYFCDAAQFTSIRGPCGDTFWQTRILEEPAYLALFQAGRCHRARGEASTLYLHLPGSAERIHRQLPHAKIIAMLRHPVDRAFSEYQHNLQLGYETLPSFESALEAEPERRALQWGFPWYYTDKSTYTPALRAYLSLFPREQCRILLFDDFARDPCAVTQALYRFLDVDDSFVPLSTKIRHLSGTPRIQWAERFFAGRAASLIARRFLPQYLRNLAYRTRQWNTRRVRLSADTRSTVARRFHQDWRDLHTSIQIDLNLWRRETP